MHQSPTAISAGASVALTASFSASRWVRDAKELGVTHASLFAAPIRMILARTPTDAPQLQLVHVWFAQNLSVAHFDEFASLCGVRPRQLYGMTETTAVVTCQHEGEECHSTIGAVIEGRSVRIDGPDGGPVERAGSDLLRVNGRRGIELFQEYLDAADVTERAFEWVCDCTIVGPQDLTFEQHSSECVSLFTTGDVVTRDDRGILRFSGRIDDIIKVSGENVSLSEIETVLSDAPGVLEVAVIALSDPMRDSVPQAHIVPRDHERPVTIAELEDYAEKHLPKAARPRSWMIVEDLPRTSVGKIRKFALRGKTSGTSPMR